MSNPSFDPSRADEPELMKQSKARPPSGDLDLSKFAPRKSGAAPGQKATYDTSTYLEKTKEEDPWPDDSAPASAAAERKVEIVSVEILTKEEDAAFDRMVKVKCVAKVTKSPPAPGLKISLQWRASATDPWEGDRRSQDRHHRGQVRGAGLRGGTGADHTRSHPRVRSEIVLRGQGDPR